MPRVTVKKKRTTAERPRSPLGRTKSGVEITDELVEALADEAERGYDLSTARRVVVGRPPLGRSGASPRIGFRAAPELHKAAKARAKREGRTVSELARDALAKYIAE